MSVSLHLEECEKLGHGVKRSELVLGIALGLLGILASPMCDCIPPVTFYFLGLQLCGKVGGWEWGVLLHTYYTALDF